MGHHFKPITGVSSLTPREKQSLRHCWNGKSLDATAEAMGVSPNTVNQWWKDARLKIGVHKTFLAALALHDHEAGAA